MTTDTYLRDHLQSRADEQAISVSSLHDITTAGDRSIRRNRIAGGFGAVIVVIVGLFGIAGLRSVETPTTMFAGLDVPVEGTPATIIATNDGWLGAVLIYNNDGPDIYDSGEIYLATSDDGESWELADPTGLVSTAQQVAIDEHDGRYWLAAAQGDQAYVAYSDDLEDWTQIEISAVTEPQAELAQGMQRSISARSVVANNQGVMTLFASLVEPDFAYLENELGIDVGESCGLQWLLNRPSNFAQVGTAEIGLRTCGQTDWQTLQVEDVALAETAQATHLFFSSNGDTFERIDPPSDAARSLYSTSTGFGIAGSQLHESTNGTNWTTLESAPSDFSAFAAAFGEQRLVASDVNTEAVQVQLRTDSQEWVTHSLDEELVFAGQDRGQRFITTGVESGQAGWVIRGFVADIPTPVMSVDSDNPFPGPLNQIVDVALPIGDLELQATSPAGTAELVDESGDVIASWDNFELGDLRRNEHIQIEDGQLTLTDADGQQVAQGPLQPVLNELQQSSGQLVSVTFFSADGETWTELTRGVNFVVAMAIGDDEVIVARYSDQGLTTTRFPLDAN